VGEVENAADDGIQRKVEDDDHRFLLRLHHRGQQATDGRVF
jgi:hypothetical protein